MDEPLSSTKKERCADTRACAFDACRWACKAHEALQTNVYLSTVLYGLYCLCREMCRTLTGQATKALGWGRQGNSER